MSKRTCLASPRRTYRVTAISEVRFRPYSKKTLFGSKKFSFVANKKLIKKNC